MKKITINGVEFEVSDEVAAEFESNQKTISEIKPDTEVWAASKGMLLKQFGHLLPDSFDKNQNYNEIVKALSVLTQSIPAAPAPNPVQAPAAPALKTDEEWQKKFQQFQDDSLKQQSQNRADISNKALLDRVMDAVSGRLKPNMVASFLNELKTNYKVDYNGDLGNSYFQGMQGEQLLNPTTKLPADVNYIIDQMHGKFDGFFNPVRGGGGTPVGGYTPPGGGGITPEQNKDIANSGMDDLTAGITSEIMKVG